jgi:alkanesulfonate monooxygenase SsuD/methylene tetrahydromethanopterin reductase-like flavin-dependent oxidoreductase (luciferase family)
MTFELGVYSFGNTPRTADGGYGATAQTIRNVLEAVHLAEEVGLDFFGFGEHHTRSMPLSSPTALVNAAAASTQRIGLGTTVTVLSTDEPIRVFQQLATAAAIAPGRVEAVAGRGSSTITFPIFDLDEREYDMLYASKLELLLAVNDRDQVTWNGPHRRRPLDSALIVPRPEQPLRIWLGSGGSPESVLRAVQLGVPLFLGILGGTPQHWAQYGHAYRDAWARAGHPAEAADIAVAVHGFVADNDREAKTTYLDHENRMFATGAAEIGRPAAAPPGRAADLEPGGMVFAGGPNEIADRILHLHQLLGHTRQILQMDVGGMPQATFLKSIELLGTEVLPQIRKQLA